MNKNNDFFETLDVLYQKPYLGQDLIQLQKIVTRFLPPWFIPMLNDKKRNLFYQKMIQKNVTGKTVLEIGAGTGLLSIEAAKTGASHVYACEVNPLLYYLAKKNIESSGFSDKITIFNCHSNDLLLEEHIPKKVDIILSELISTDIFTENMISSLENSQKLLKKGGVFLPGSIKCYGSLIQYNGSLPQEALDPDIFPEVLINMTKDRSLMFNLAKVKFKPLNKPKLIFSISDGFKVSHEFPLHLKLKVSDKRGYKNTFFSFSFALIDKGLRLDNFNIEDMNEHNHWGNLLWRLTPNKTEYKLKLVQQDNKLYLFEE